MAALSRRKVDLDDKLPQAAKTFNPSFLQTAFIRRVAMKNKVINTGTALHSDGQPVQEYPATQNRGDKSRVPQMWRSSIMVCVGGGGKAQERSESCGG